MSPDPTLIGWHYKRGQRHIGPLRIQEVAQLLSKGQLQPAEMLIEIGEMTTPTGPDVRYSYFDAASAVKRAAAMCAQLRFQHSHCRAGRKLCSATAPLLQ